MRRSQSRNRMERNIIFHLVSMPSQNSKEINITLLTISLKVSISLLSRWNRWNRWNSRKRSLWRSRSSSKSDWRQLFTITSRCSITVATSLVFCTTGIARLKMTSVRSTMNPTWPFFGKTATWNWLNLSNRCNREEISSIPKSSTCFSPSIAKTISNHIEDYLTRPRISLTTWSQSPNKATSRTITSSKQRPRTSKSRAPTIGSPGRSMLPSWSMTTASYWPRACKQKRNILRSCSSTRFAWQSSPRSIQITRPLSIQGATLQNLGLWARGWAIS